MALKSMMLDTSAYSAFKRGYNQVIVAVQQARAILLPAIVIGELLAGFELGTQLARNQRELAEFQDSPRVQVVPITQETAARYAHIFAQLRRGGHPIPTNDLWIAASAMEYGAVLMTTDKHFLDIPQIIVRRIQAPEQ
jgi:tRNA(fMet)-specific endonuclease VapC